MKTGPCSITPDSIFLSLQEAEVVTSMSFHPTGDFILVGTEHPTSELLYDNFILPENHTLKSTNFFSTTRFVVWDKMASKTESREGPLIGTCGTGVFLREPRQGTDDMSRYCDIRTLLPRKTLQNVNLSYLK